MGAKMLESFTSVDNNDDEDDDGGGVESENLGKVGK